MPSSSDRGRWGTWRSWPVRTVGMLSQTLSHRPIRDKAAAPRRPVPPPDQWCRANVRSAMPTRSSAGPGSAASAARAASGPRPAGRRLDPVAADVGPFPAGRRRRRTCRDRPPGPRRRGCRRRSGTAAPARANTRRPVHLGLRPGEHERAVDRAGDQAAGLQCVDAAEGRRRLPPVVLQVEVLAPTIPPTPVARLSSSRIPTRTSAPPSWRSATRRTASANSASPARIAVSSP